jgi:hypothetical protein
MKSKLVRIRMDLVEQMALEKKTANDIIQDHYFKHTEPIPDSKLYDSLWTEIKPKVQVMINEGNEIVISNIRKGRM